MRFQKRNREDLVVFLSLGIINIFVMITCSELHVFLIDLVFYESIHFTQLLFPCFRLTRKSQSTTESFDNGLLVDADEDESDDDERPDSVDDKVRQKEMRKGIDLATTLERIEKNFVITDPRLPDNPIVSLRIPATSCKLEVNL